MPASDEPAPKRRLRRGWSIALYAVGVLLIAAAVWVIVRQQDTLAQAAAAARDAPAWLIAAVFVLPLLSWLCTNGIYWTLTRRYGVVGWWEMAALIATAWLLNYLPLRPGMFGRVAYHKAVNGIALKDSARVIALAVSCTAIGAALMVAAAVAVRMLVPEAQRPQAMLATQATLGLVLVLSALALHAVRPNALGWRVAAGLAWRFADVLIWALRYWAAFTLVGRPIDFTTATGLAAVAQVGMLAPIQFGAREWLVGLFSPITLVGLTADLINRAVEIVLALPLGLAASLWLYRRRTELLGPTAAAAAHPPAPADRSQK